jgi:DNA-directed RNA polymerase subunit RPC12/RpoP
MADLKQCPKCGTIAESTRKRRPLSMFDLFLYFASCGLFLLIELLSDSNEYVCPSCRYRWIQKPGQPPENIPAAHGPGWDTVEERQRDQSHLDRLERWNEKYEEKWRKDHEEDE